MVGDSSVDVTTVRNANVRACGVARGFQPETSEHAPPDFVIDDLNALADMVLRDGRAVAESGLHHHGGRRRIVRLPRIRQR
mgnify:CR=1 FL=1